MTTKPLGRKPRYTDDQILEGIREAGPHGTTVDSLLIWLDMKHKTTLISRLRRLAKEGRITLVERARRDGFRIYANGGYDD